MKQGIETSPWNMLNSLFQNDDESGMAFDVLY